MRFLAPSLLLGLAAALLPWLIHRIGHRRANPVRFAAMELLLRAERQVSARRRLREFLLLLMRTAIAAVLPLVFAKPYTEIKSDLPATTSLPQAAVIILDDSASMRRTRPSDGTPLFDRARQRARGLLDNLAPESDVALVMASEGTATPVPEPTVDRARMLAALDAAACSARRADFTGAMRKAVQVLSTAQRQERIIYLITDLQAVGWEGGSGLPESDGATVGTPGVVILDVNQGVAWPNRAVVELTAEPAPEAGPLGVAVVAEIANFGPEPISNVGITLRLDGAPVAKGFVDLPARGRAHKRFLHSLGAGASVREAEVEIDHDRFPLDDRRLTRVEISRGLRILVVDGDPRTVRTEDETFFLEAALRAGGSSFSVTSALPDELSGRTLAEYGSIFLANVARPSSEVAAALIQYVETGGGLFISVGDKVDADAWNQQLGRILPQPLGLKRTASARPGSNAEGETVDLRPAERLAPFDRRHPLLAGFPPRGDGLSSARFFQFMLLEPAPDMPNRSAVLRYENGAPALVEAEVGRGRVLLLTTTVDREWTDLPIRPGFLPLMQEAARRLAGAPSGEAVAALTVGQRREITVGADDRRIEVIKPNGESRWLTPETRPGDRKPARAVLFAETDEPGWYRVRGAHTDGSQIDRPDDAFVVNFDVRESDPATLPADQRPDRARAAAGGDDRAPKRRLELWHVLAAAVLGLVFFESLLTIKFRRGRFI